MLSAIYSLGLKPDFDEFDGWSVIDKNGTYIGFDGDSVYAITKVGSEQNINVYKQAYSREVIRAAAQKYGYKEVEQGDQIILRRYV